MTLTQIVDLIAGRLNDPFNHLLKERLKDAVRVTRSLFIRRDFERNPYSGQYIQKVVQPLIKVDASDDCAAVSDCIILRTKDKIPVARLNSSSDFLFVGDKLFKEGWKEVGTSGLEFANFTKYKTSAIHWEHLNNYIYVYGNIKLKYVGIKAVFDNLDIVTSLCVNSTNCFADDEEFPVSGDMLALIIEEVFRQESSLIYKDNKEVEVDEKTNIVNNDGGGVRRTREN